MLARQTEYALFPRVGRHVHDLNVIVRGAGLILRGQASTYYAKQLTQHVADRVCGLPVLANEIAGTCMNGFHRGFLMKRLLSSLLIAAFAFGTATVVGHGGEPPQAKTAELMRKKLQQLQKVLEGIALNDFDKIIQHADELILISKETEFKVMKTPQYELYTGEFRRNAEDLVKKAKEKNIDGSTLAYMELTLTCVRCHKHCREVRMTSGDRPQKALGE
jgi:hypothetical protein